MYKSWDFQWKNIFIVQVVTIIVVLVLAGIVITSAIIFFFSKLIKGKIQNQDDVAYVCMAPVHTLPTIN